MSFDPKLIVTFYQHLLFLHETVEWEPEHKK